jgi:hypothetical protein
MIQREFAFLDNPGRSLISEHFTIDVVDRTSRAAVTTTLIRQDERQRREE